MPVDSEQPVEIAALKVQQARHVNVLAAGAGTPWEDRGSLGVVVAFFKTVGMSMFSPRRLFALIRRPETIGDAHTFALVCTFFWGLGWLLWDIIRYVRTPQPPDSMGFDISVQGVGWAIHFALGMGGAWLLIKLIARFLHSLLTAGGTGASYPPSVIYNIVAYSMGPSILALIPFMIGPGLAVLWITGLFITAAVSRLDAKPMNAAVCSLMANGLFLGASAGVYHLLYFLAGWLGYIPK